MSEVPLHRDRRDFPDGEKGTPGETRGRSDGTGRRDDGTKTEYDGSEVGLERKSDDVVKIFF